MNGPTIARTDLFSCLVTRHTGRAVRTTIERQLERFEETVLAVLDLTHVELIDFSCADEIVAKLVVAGPLRTTGGRRYFLFRGIAEHHVETIEFALTRQGLAAAAETVEGLPLVIGEIRPEAARAWREVWTLGRTEPESLAQHMSLSRETVVECLLELERRALVMRDGDSYVSFGRALRDQDGEGPSE